MKNPPVMMKRTASGLSPASSFDAEMLYRYGMGALVEVLIKQRRSNKHLRFFWVICYRVIESGATPFASKEELADALKMSCGLTEIRQDMAGNYYTRPSSIAFERMDEASFKEFTERAFAMIAAHYGINVETQKRLARGDDV